MDASSGDKAGMEGEARKASRAGGNRRERVIKMTQTTNTTPMASTESNASALSNSFGAQKRTVSTTKKTAGLGTQDLILVAVLLAAGAVLKLTVGTLFQSFGMKPNFVIAMYCLAIILTRPKVGQAVAIGLVAGLICQLPMLNATPGLNIVSETLGALVCGLLVRVPMNLGGKADMNPLVNTFLSTVVSGGTFALIAIYINVVNNPASDTTVAAALISYALIVLGTATFNAILNQILVPVMRKVLKR